MQRLLIWLIAILLSGCFDRSGSSPPISASASMAGRTTVVQADTANEGMRVKQIPARPDPASQARDPESCLRAGGEWANAYRTEILLTREPQEGAEYVGKVCWSNRAVNKLPDAGKSCSGPNDCIGNCVSRIQHDGSWSPPQCQSFGGEIECQRVIDGDKFEDLNCPAP